MSHVNGAEYDLKIAILRGPTHTGLRTKQQEGKSTLSGRGTNQDANKPNEPEPEYESRGARVSSHSHKVKVHVALWTMSPFAPCRILHHVVSCTVSPFAPFPLSVMSPFAPCRTFLTNPFPSTRVCGDSSLTLGHCTGMTSRGCRADSGLYHASHLSPNSTSPRFL